jgi:hypothetical protein
LELGGKFIETHGALLHMKLFLKWRELRPISSGSREFAGCMQLQATIACLSYNANN